MDMTQQDKRPVNTFHSEFNKNDCVDKRDPGAPCSKITIDRNHPVTSRLNPVTVSGVVSDKDDLRSSGEMAIVGIYLEGELLGVPLNTRGRYEVIVWCDWEFTHEQRNTRDRVAGTMAKIDKIVRATVRDADYADFTGTPHTGFRVVMTKDTESSDDAMLQVIGFLTNLQRAFEQRAVRSVTNTPYSRSAPFHAS